MQQLTEKPKTIQSEQATAEAWIASLRAPICSRIMPVPTNSDIQESRDTSSAKAKRQLEFEAGRRCAESLLKRLGNSEQVWTNEDRSPVWPVGFTGSISHSENWTWSAVAKLSQIISVGIDTEPVVPTETRQQIAHEVGTPAEWDLCQQSGLTPDEIFSVVFSAKETFYKCCYPIVQQYFGFEHAVVERIEADRIQIRTHSSHPCFDEMPESLFVYYHVTPENVFTITTMETA